MSNVKSMFGGPTGEPEPCQATIDVLEEYLELARSGEVIGIVLAGLHKDRLATFRLGGKLGAYSILGAVEIMKHRLVEHLDGD